LTLQIAGDGGRWPCGGAAADAPLVSFFFFFGVFFGFIFFFFLVFYFVLFLFRGGNLKRRVVGYGPCGLYYGRHMSISAQADEEDGGESENAHLGSFHFVDTFNFIKTW
jgi:hypothetical protein